VLIVNATIRKSLKRKGFHARVANQVFPSVEAVTSHPREGAREGPGQGLEPRNGINRNDINGD
jgi:hypothetical protein